MHAAQALNLRKSNRTTDTHSVDAVSRTGPKKNNIKEILVRNFFRKYPIAKDLNDKQQLQIEREVANQFEAFVVQTRDISTRNLTEFETRVAASVRLDRRASAGTGCLLESPGKSIQNAASMALKGQLGGQSHRHDFGASPLIASA